MSVKDRNKTITGTGLTSGGHGDAWRIGPRYDERGGLEGTEDLYLSSKYRDSDNQGMAAGRALSERLTGYSRRGGRRDTEWVKEGDSIWKNVAMAGAATAGLGVAGAKLWSSRSVLQDLFAGARASAVAAAAPTFAQEFVSKYEKAAPGMQAEMMKNAIEAIRNISKTKGGVAPALAEALWMKSRARGDPRGIVSGALSAAGDPIESILLAAEEHLQGGKIHPAWPRTLETFRRRFGAVASSTGAGADFGPLAPIPTWSTRAIGLEEVYSTDLRGTLGRMREALGEGATLSLRLAEREGAVGGEYWVGLTGGELGERKVRLRLSRSLIEEEAARIGLPGLGGKLVATGVAQQTLRGPGTFAQFTKEGGVWTQKSFNYEEFAARRYEAELIPQIINGKLRDQRQIRQAQRVLDEQIILAHAPHGIDPVARMQAEIEASRVHAYLPDWGVPTEEQQIEIMRANKGRLYPGLSPKRMIGSEYRGRAPILSTLDPARSSVLGHTPISRRPWQGMTRQYFPTVGAVRAMQAHPVHARSAYLVPPAVGESFGADYASRFRAMYVSERHMAAMSQLGMDPGEALMLRSLRARREVYRYRNPYADPEMVSKFLASAEAVEVEKGKWELKIPLTAAGKGDVTGLQKGQEIGFTSEGSPIRMKGNWEVLGYQTFPLAARADEEATTALRLRIRETLPPEQTPKFFGLKADVLETGGGRFADVRRALGVGGFGEEAIFMGDLLKKDRSRHNLQMFSAMVEFTHENLFGRGGRRSLSVHEQNLLPPIERMLATEPEMVKGRIQRFMQRLEAMDKPATTIDDMVAKYIYRLSRRTSLSPAQTGRVFGLLPDVLPGQGTEAERLAAAGFRFNPWELREIGKGVAGGVADMYYGGPMGLTGAGKMGTLEPRAWEMLSGPHAGAFGEILKTEFGARALAAEPHLAQGQAMLNIALAEMAGAPHGGLPEGLRRLKLGELTEEMLNPQELDWLGKEGALVETGLTGAKNIFVPPEESLRAVYPNIGGAGPITSPLAAAYSSMLRTAQGGKPEATKAAVDALRQELGSARAATIREAMAARQPGSRYFRIRSPEHLRSAKGAGVFTMGVPFKQGREMIKELMQLHPEERDALKGMLGRFEAGEAIGGVGARHPIFGPYNISPLLVRGIESAEPIMEVPSRWVNVRVPSMGDITHTIDVGPMAGWAADKDADTVFASVLRPKAEQEAAKTVGSQAWRTHYENFAIRDQLLKNIAKAKGGVSLTRAEEMIADTLKLGTPQAHLPLISHGLTQARRRVLASSLAAESKMNLWGLFSALEQIPISGKHLSSAEVISGGLRGSLGRIGGALRQGAGGELVEAARSLFKVYGADDPNKKAFVQGILGGGLDVEVEGVTRRIAGLDLGQAARDMAEAFREVPGSYARQLNLTTRLGKSKKLKLGESEVAKMLGFGGGPFSGFILPTETGVMARVSRTTSTVLNEAATMGRGMMRIASKPLAWGFGGAIGLGLILSKPMGTLKPGDSAPPASGMMPPPGGGMGPAQNVHPDQQVAGEPSIPRSIPPGDASIAPMSYGKGTGRYNIDVHGGTGKNMDYQQIAALVRQRLGRSGQANIHVQDRRSTLTPQKLNDIMG